MKFKTIAVLAGVGLGLGLFAASCSSQKIPQGAEPVQNFNADKYLGKWYEIARYDFAFEKNIDDTMAEYTLNNDGSIKVVNSGYNYKKEKWTKAEGKAKFRDSKDVGALKVSFFGPFYSPYNVIALEGDYQHALVAGKNLDYLWILSRDKTIPEEVKNRFLTKAQSLGYNTSELVWPTHNRTRPAQID